MKIAICDDEVCYINELKKFLLPYDNAEIFEFKSPVEIINCNLVFDIAFIDIEMDEHDGFEIADLIYKRNKDCVISFYSNHSSYAIKGYKYHIYRYILKEEPDMTKQLLVREIVQEYGNRSKTLKIKEQGNIINIFLKEIYYIESFRKLIVLHTERKELTCYESLKYFEQECVPYSFIRIHKSFIVNSEKIRLIKSNRSIELKNGVVLPIGKKYLENVKDLFKTF